PLTVSVSPCNTTAITNRRPSCTTAMCNASRRATTRWSPRPATPCTTCGRWRARVTPSRPSSTRPTRGRHEHRLHRPRRHGPALEAPWSGGTVGAEKGTLTLMVGGDAATIEVVRPVFDAVGSLVVHVGGPGMGQVVKLCNNLIYAAQMVATAEATALAVKSGA